MGRGVSKNAVVVDVTYKPGAARKQDVFTREIDEPFHESSTHPLEAYLCYLVRTRPLVDRLTVTKSATGATVTLDRDTLRAVDAKTDYAALAEQLEELRDGSGGAPGAASKPEDQEIGEEELGQAEEDEPIEDEDEEEPVNPEFEDDGWYYSDED